MAVHGFNVTDNIEAYTWEKLPGSFSTYSVQAIIENAYRTELKAAAESKLHGRWRITTQEIANRVADKLVQKWKKQGKLALKTRGTWVKVA
jgi:hypothetical protein